VARKPRPKQSKVNEREAILAKYIIRNVRPTSPGDILERSLVRGPVGGEALPARKVRAGGSRPLKPSTKRFRRDESLANVKRRQDGAMAKKQASPFTPGVRDNGKCRDLSQDFGETWRYPARINPRRSSSRYDGIEFLPSVHP
jgi:hypothetical protein